MFRSHRGGVSSSPRSRVAAPAAGRSPGAQSSGAPSRRSENGNRPDPWPGPLSSPQWQNSGALTPITLRWMWSIGTSSRRLGLPTVAVLLRSHISGAGDAPAAPQRVDRGTDLRTEERRDAAERVPGRYVEAGKYDVMPVDASGLARIVSQKPLIAAPRARFVRRRAGRGGRRGPARAVLRVRADGTADLAKGHGMPGRFRLYGDGARRRPGSPVHDAVLVQPGRADLRRRPRGRPTQRTTTGRYASSGPFRR